MSGFGRNCVSVSVVSIEVGSVSLVEIFVRMRIVSVVIVLHLLLLRMPRMLLLRLGMMILTRVLSISIVSSRDVTIGSNHFSIRMFNVPERILNTAEISYKIRDNNLDTILYTVQIPTRVTFTGLRLIH